MIRFLQLLLACLAFAAIGFFLLQDAPTEQPSKYKFFAAKYQPESQEYKDLYAHYSTLEDVPMPVGSWEGYSSNGHHFLLKVNEKGGFVLSLNPNANDTSEGAVTGVLNITGQAFRAHHVIGSAKNIIPKSGHIVVKQYTVNQVLIIHPRTLEVVTFNRVVS
ncbi:hypothetical protein MD588_08880 [Photobacterium sp. SDRW27]|uniref:hypothetical protein n=1 Tax=Photobacterium obscurum TaxID=2829490 RepID=UPI002244624D|nr:hypothetical protein [Photobacterium obscurum]MCW8328922.1 hypothetical protein [Photobacterium obscurum]